MSNTDVERSIIDDINKLKKDKNAVILVHNYQRPEVFEVADHVGDSLALCNAARDTDADIIVFCGVHFMAESAAILNPGKKVLMPTLDAGCAMADMISVDGLNSLKSKHPNAMIVCYVNTSAAIKAVSDICCTSSNAVDVVNSLDCDEVIFVPDKNLAKYVASKVPGKKIIPWDGYCPVHHAVSRSFVEEMREANPGAKIIAHPESRPDVLEIADYVASTSGMIDVAAKDPAKKFFVLTECGMTERLNKSVTGKSFSGICNMCFDMKMNDLSLIYQCLVDENPLVKVDAGTSRLALKAFDRMFEVSN